MRGTLKGTLTAISRQSNYQNFHHGFVFLTAALAVARLAPDAMDFPGTRDAHRGHISQFVGLLMAFENHTASAWEFDIPDIAPSCEITSAGGLSPAVTAAINSLGEYVCEPALADPLHRSQVGINRSFRGCQGHTCIRDLD